MKTATVAEVASDFTGYLKASKEEPLVVIRNGKPVAVLVPATDPDDVERLLLGHSARLQSILEGARKRFRAGQGIPHEEFWTAIETGKAAAGTKKRGSRKNGRAPQ